ncbi:hypothetical protein E2542_SST01201 [Spatholobus suberectus]|nr:hypothetical protein E2542_SST01201 [Spatholobus suberectus]
MEYFRDNSVRSLAVVTGGNTEAVRVAAERGASLSRRERSGSRRRRGGERGKKKKRRAAAGGDFQWRQMVELAVVGLFSTLRTPLVALAVVQNAGGL